MYRLLIFITISLISTRLFADWQVESFDHSSTNTQTHSAVIKNESGFELAIFQTSEGIVWMDFSLSDNSLDEFSQTQLPVFQIDNQKPVKMLRGFTATIVPADEGIEAIIVTDPENISTDRDFSVNHIIAERLPERVICPIWQGESRPHLGTLQALSNGHQIHFNFTLLDNSKGQTSFSLKGAKQALATIINK
jgi:hypothetical protein